MVKTKPFDLEAALNGAEVVTRDGRLVQQLHRFDAEDGQPVYGVVGGSIMCWSVDGSYWDIGESEFDLLLAIPGPKIIERWLNIYGSHSVIHPTKERADVCAGTSRIGDAVLVQIPGTTAKTLEEING